MLLSDRITGSLVAALGGAAAVAGSRLPPVPGQDVGPAVFPTLIGILLVICGVLIVFGIGRRFEESAEAAVVRSEEAHGVVHLDAPTFQRNLLAVLPPVLLTFYVVVVEFFGFLPTAFTIVVAMVFAFGGRLVLALSMGVAAPVLLHIVFYKLLRVPLPAGLLPAPW